MGWKKLGERRYQAGWRKMVNKQFVMPGGGKIDFDILADEDTVSVLVVTPDQHVVLVKQFRPGPEKELLELPGGRIEVGQTPEQAAAREVREETGYVGELQKVGTAWTGAYATVQCHQFVMLNSKQMGEPELEEGEVVEVMRLSRQEFFELLRGGELTDQGTGYKAADFLGWL